MKLKNLSAALLSGIAMIAIAGAPRGADKAAPTHFDETIPTAPSNEITVVHSRPAQVIVAHVEAGSIAARLLESVQSDEILERSPFDGLSTYEPFNSIFKKIVVSYDRRTLRSPKYRAEQGYDVVVYDIHHPLSGISRLMAYAEGDIVKVVMLTGRPGEDLFDLVIFEGQTLNSQRQISWSEAQALFDQDLANASTLMSASVR